MIQIPLFNQADPRWASLPLGTSGVTMRSHGCYVTSVAMILNNFGKSVNPGQLCEALNAINGFTPDGDLKWEAIEKLYPDVVFYASMWTTLFTKGANLLKVEQAEAMKKLARLTELGIPVLLCVDNVGKDQRPDHAIVYRGERISHDPDGGIEVRMEDGHKYGALEKAVYGLRVIVGSPVSFPDSTSDDTAALATAAWKAALVARGKFVSTYSREIADHILRT